MNWIVESLNNLELVVVVLEKTFVSPFGYKGIKPVNPKGNES